MRTLLSLLRPAPYIEEIQDPETVKKEYHYWRIRILYSMFIGYALFYLTRKSFTFATPAMVEQLGLTKGDIGLLGSIFSIIYGFSKFGSGIMSDQSNPRYFMAIGLILTGVMNIFFGMCSSMFFFALFWGLNGWFQGFGWPPCARFLTHWYSHSERGSWWSTWNVSHNVGSFLIPWVVGASITFFVDWRYAMYIPAIFCIFGGFFLINRLRDTPQSLGLPPIEKFRNDYNGWKAEDDSEKPLSTKQMLMDYVLKNPYIWMLSFAYFFLYIVRIGINDWTMLFLAEEKGYSKLGAAGVVSLFEGGGFAGSLIAGWASDKLFGARRGPINLIFSVGMLAALLMMWALPKTDAFWDSVAVFSVGFFIFGPQMLIGVAVAELSHKKAAATSTGFAGCLGYLGSSVAGYPLGIVTQEWGWNGYFWFLVVCSGATIALLAPLWSVDRNSVTIKQPMSKPEPEAA